ncbi:MAG: TIGR02757 family protein [Rhodobacterales bacterium]|nr:TIGR02757 family protein [Rhodobacterales bacterium]
MLTQQQQHLKERLDALKGHIELEARVSTDPVFFVHRYTVPADQELAGIFASTLAYGRVASFFSVLHPLFDYIDQHGGPSKFVRDFHGPAHEPFLLPLRYRFNTGPDWILLFEALQACLQSWHTVADIFDGNTAQEALETGIQRLRTQAAAQLQLPDESSLPRGFRYWLPRPSSGSACKRWNLYMRWMVRPNDGVDLGVWTHLPIRSLIIPVDTHLHRVAGFLGLTDRRAADWKTAVQITHRLSMLNPDDPVGYDFSLCHLGISGACRGHRVASVCPACPLEPFCTAPTRAQRL